MDKIVVMTAAWCGPCKMLKPLIEEVSNEFDSIQVEVVDIDSPDGQTLCAKHNVRGIPTCIAFDGDEVLKTKVGSMSKTEVVQFFTI